MAEVFIVAAFVVHRCLDGCFNVAFVVAVEAFHADGVVERPQEAMVNENILAIMHVDAVGIVAPATDDFHIGNADIAASDGADIVNETVTDGDAVDNDIGAVFQLDGVQSRCVVHGCVVVLLIGFEMDGFTIVTVVENASSKNSDVFGIKGANACEDHGSFVKEKRLPVFQIDHADFMDATAVIND